MINQSAKILIFFKVTIFFHTNDIFLEKVCIFAF